MIESLQRQQLNWEDIEDNLTRSIFIVEKELGHTLDENYPYMKFLVELEELENYLEKQQNNI